MASRLKKASDSFTLNEPDVTPLSPLVTIEQVLEAMARMGLAFVQKESSSARSNNDCD